MTPSVARPPEAGRDPRIDIAHTVYSFAYGIDQRDWDAYRSIFVAPPGSITFDYESYSGRPATSMTADEWLATVRPLFDGLHATQHTMSNPIVEISDRSARCRMYMQAAHFLWNDEVDEPEFTIGGYYDDHLVLQDDGQGGTWRIDAVALTVWWRRGNSEIMDIARRTSRPRP
jgi:hypothetical protein